MKHTPHGYWLEEAGESAAAPPLAADLSTGDVATANDVCCGGAAV